MGASRKLQGEIDRVLKKVQEGVDVFDSIWNKVYDTDNANLKEKFEADLKKEIKKLQRYRDQIKTWIQSSEIKDKKVSASYEQALMDARKQIEREMERFKICEKETKTKAFSKEGLGQQPKTDPREKAKSETRDWLNNVVSELENQIDSFEAEIEGLSVKKGKTKPPRLTHLEASIVRHKAHIMKLELILRLLDNDELSPDQVNDVKDFLDDYVERNQEDFDEFSDVDELYHTLPLDKVESLEDLVPIGPPGIAKGISASSGLLGTKTPLATATQAPVILVPDQVDERGFQEEAIAKTPTTRSSSISTSTLHTIHVAGHSISSTSSALSSAISSSVPKEEETANSGRKALPSHSENGLRTIGRVGLPNQNSPIIPPISGNMVSNSGAANTATSPSDIGKRNLLGSDDRSFGAVTTESLMSPLTNRVILPQVTKASDGHVSADTGSVGDTSVIGSRVLSSGIPSMHWRPGSFQDQNEVFHGRTEIMPDQREKFLQRFQQVQQQGQANLLGMPSGGKQYPAPQQSVFLQQNASALVPQFNTPTPTTQPQLGLGLGTQASGLNTGAASASVLLQQSTIPNSSNQNFAISTASKDAETDVTKVEELQQLQSVAEDSEADSSSLKTGVDKSTMQDDETKASLPLENVPAVTIGLLAEHPQIRSTDLSPGLPLQPVSTSGNLGIIGRRSASDLGTIGDNLSVSANSSAVHDVHYNLQMLEAAYNKLPQPKDSERVNAYVPRRPAATPPNYPQSQAPIIHNPALWERLGSDTYGTDTLFFAFYYQQNTYQQYLAAKELKKQSWRYHRKFNTWFQRHEEPKVTTDDFEQGAYVYFDFHISNDEQHGWCQRIKTDFTFEYSFLEDDLIA